VVSPATTGDLTNKKYIEWLTDKNGLNSNLHSDPTSLPKIHGTIMCWDQVSPGNDPWKWVIKLEKTGRYPNRQRWSKSPTRPARTSTTASSTTTVLPDPPIPCLAPGAQPAAAAMDGGIGQMGLSENSVPLHPMVLLIIIPIINGYNWEYTPFSDIPKYYGYGYCDWAQLSFGICHEVHEPIFH